MRSDTTSNIIKALVKARSEVPSIPKNGKSHFGKYALLDDIIEITTPILTDNGLAIVSTYDAHNLILTLHHVSGEFLSSNLEMIIDKKTSQGMGIACTYSRRYALSSLLNLSLDDDTDGNYERPQPKQKKSIDPLAFLSSLLESATLETIDGIQTRWDGVKNCNKDEHNQGYVLIENKTAELRGKK